MKQFLTVFKFELLGYMKNKLFIGLTVAIVIIFAAILFFPRISAGLEESDISLPGSEEEAKVVSVLNQSELSTEMFTTSLGTALGEDYTIELAKSEKSIRDAVKSGDIETGIVIETPTSYKYIVETIGMYDNESAIVSRVLLNLHRYTFLQQVGLDESQIATAMDSNIDCETLVTGSDQTKSFLYTYAILMVLYMVLMLYGQFVSNSVAAEKSTRAMEVLITSAKPLNIMFGKILGSGVAGLAQLLVILLSAFGFYRINEAYIDNEIITALFDMPISAVVYTVVFFILGFFIYAFIYGAAGSLATRTEDLNTLTLPVNFLYIFTFMVAIIEMNSGSIDTGFMQVLSFLPTFAPFLMLVRVCMGSVAVWEIALSIGIQIISIIGLGFLCAKIYRAGVLMYGNTPKLKDIIKILREAKTL